jgi:hypothetical protein
MKSSKMLKKANALKGFLGSMGKKKGEMGMGMTPPSKKITSSQSKSLNVATGTPYKTTSMPSDKINTVRSSFNSPPRNSAEVNAYMQSKRKPSMKKGGSFPDLNKDGQITKADILMGRGVIDKPKGQKGMNVIKEAKKNATPSIPNSYYKMGGIKEQNPLASMIKKKPMKKSGMKPKMAMGGSFFPQNPLTASKYQNDTLMGQSFKKGGMVKKKKK